MKISVQRRKEVFVVTAPTVSSTFQDWFDSHPIRKESGVEGGE
jgi:hypothetical protein